MSDPIRAELAKLRNQMHSLKAENAELLAAITPERIRAISLPPVGELNDGMPWCQQAVDCTIGFREALIAHFSDYLIAKYGGAK